jgi:hypothetical protein
MNDFLRFLFRKKEKDPKPSTRAGKMLDDAKANATFVPLVPEVNRYESVKEENSVTGIYAQVKTAMEGAVQDKRKAKEAAQRVSAAIGTAGQEKPKP